MFTLPGINPARSPGRTPWSTATTGPTRTPWPDKIGAWVMCEQFVEQELVAPCTAEFGRYQESMVDDGEFLVLGQVDAQDSFGVVIRNDYLCHMRCLGNDRWRLLGLDFVE